MTETERFLIDLILAIWCVNSGLIGVWVIRNLR